MKKYIILFTFFSMCTYVNAQNFCESITYIKLNTHLIKCSFKNIIQDLSNLEEFYINEISSTLYVEYLDLDKTLYILGIFRNIELDESNKINMFDLEFDDITLRNKGLSSLKKSYNITDKISEFINDFKSYISEKFSEGNMFDKVKKITKNLIDDVSKTFKNNKDDLKIYYVNFIYRNKLKHCIDIKTNSIKCLKVKI